ncbi:MAG: hypothetical protein OM95_07005 [Bdellovibrio sp. ArHS]|uniref:hypothetical protein n=1 Tax=Bdellovibrio sp. ArHS TaxID=1569284 RepID=UPI0005835372|nr:hypothetical protein [Bdellovibrio sp. ArHS]KHD88858.1 MAG: hypothetical protein OM95_07005 [Bdellovibrio sp. ArHS]
MGKNGGLSRRNNVKFIEVKMSEVKFDETAFKKWYESSPGAFGYTPVACARWQFEQLQSELKKKDELLRECEKVLEKYKNQVWIISHDVESEDQFAARKMLQKLREVGK